MVIVETLCSVAALRGQVSLAKYIFDLNWTNLVKSRLNQKTRFQIANHQSVNVY